MTDRTEEFRGAVKVFRPTVVINGAGNPAQVYSHSSVLDQRPPQAHSSEFVQLAASVAVGFEGTSKLIGRLKKLVGRKGFSNNPAAEINDVMKLFEGDMAGLQKDIASLQRHAEGKRRDSPPANSQRQKHYAHIVATLKKSAQEHTMAFRDALLLRAAVEKQQNDRQRIFSHSRGVAPAAQLDYPLFGGRDVNGKTGLRSRPHRRPAAPPRPPPAPPLAPPAGVEKGRSSPPTSRDGEGRGLGAAAASSPKTAFPTPAARAAEKGYGNGVGGGVGVGVDRDSWRQGQPQPPPPPAAMPRPSDGGMVGVNGGSGLRETGGERGGGGEAGGRYGVSTTATAATTAGGGGGGRGDPFGATPQQPFGRAHHVSAGNDSTVPSTPPPPPQRGGAADFYGARYGGGGMVAGNGAAAAAQASTPPTEAFRAGSGGASGLRKRPQREDGGAGEEESRRAAWQLQVQEDSKTRVEESHKVEKMIGELGQMFSRFSTMVAAQEEVVIHIEDDVEAAHTFAEEGQANLARYYQIMSGNRGIIVKVFVMLIVFIWVFLGLMR